MNVNNRQLMICSNCFSICFTFSVSNPVKETHR